MAFGTSIVARVGQSRRAGLALMAIGVLAVAGGLVRTTTSTPDGKVFVCKYVGTPGVDETLQSGNNPISVSISSIKDYQGVGSYFGDGQGRSYVLALDVGQPTPPVSDCPPPTPSSSTTSVEPTTTTTSVAHESTTTTTVGDQPTTTTTVGDQPTTTTTLGEQGVTTTTVANPHTTTSVEGTTTTIGASGNTTPTTARSQTASTTTVPVSTHTKRLPFTGAASTPLIGLGSLLFAAGAAITIVSMRRRRAA